MKTNLKYLLLCAFLLTLLACGGNDAPQTTSDESDSTNDVVETDSSGNTETEDEPKTIVTFAVNGFEQGLYQNRIEAFEQANPNIEIELIGIEEILGNTDPFFGENADEHIIDLVKSADVIALNPTRANIEQELILDLSPLMAGDAQFNVDDFYPAVLEQYQQDGGTWALPLTVGYSVIVFDKTKFDEAGLDYPEAGWTWAEFVATAQALTNESADGNQWGFDVRYSSPLEMIEAVAQRPLIDTTTQPATVNFEHPDIVDAFQWYADLAHVHKVMPINDNISDGPISGFDDENAVAMWIESTDFMDTDYLERGNLGIVPYPVSSADDKTSPISRSFGFGNSFVISAGSNKVDAAWSWLKFLSQQASEDVFFMSSASLPARKSTAEASDFWDELPEAIAEPMRYATEHSFSPTQLPFDSLLYSIPFQIIENPTDITSILATAQTDIENSMQEADEALAQATAVPSFSVDEPPSSQIPEGATVIRFVTTSGNPEPYRELAETFQEVNPDIVVDVEEPNYFGGDFSMAGLVGEADCFHSFSSLDSPDDLAAVLSIQPFIDADPELSEADFYASVLDSFRKQGQLMGLPSEVNIRILAFDKRMFDAAGIDYPTADWTMDEFLETAVALTQGSGETKIYGFKPSEFEQSDLVYMMSQLGAQFVDDSVDPPQMSFTHPDTISAMRWYANLSTEYEVRPAPIDPFSSFGFDFNSSPEQNAAIWSADPFGGVVFIGEDSEGAEQDTSHIGYVPYPSVSGSTGYENATGLYISSQTEQRQACWEWIKYLSYQPSLIQIGVPAHISTAESEAYSQLVGDEKATTFRTILENSSEPSELNRFMSGASWLSVTTLWLSQAHLDIVNEGVSVEEALQEAQSKADTYRTCIIQQDALTETEKQFECLQEIDPDLFG